MRIKGILASFLSIAIVGQSVQAVPYGTPAFSPTFAVSIPSSLGYITDAYATHSASAPDMVLIQNLHVNRSVQFAISGILKRLKAQGLMPDHIAVEGATGPIDIASMQRYPDPVIRKEAADYLVKQGEMPGAMHFAVTEGVGGLFGIETDEYYQANLEMFRRSYKGRATLRRELNKIQAVLPRLEKDLATRENAVILEKDITAVNELINNQTTSEDLIPTLKQASQAVEHLKLVLPQDTAANLLEPLSASVNFYALALLRDQELFKNTLSVRELGQQKTSIVITGGFHTQGMTEECKRHGLSYVVITPRIRHHDKIDENLYIDRLMGIHLSPEQVAQGLNWSLMEQLEPVYQAGSLFGSAVRAVTLSSRGKIATALLSAILLFSHGMQAQKKQLPPPPPLRTPQQWADFIHEQRPMTASKELGLPLTFREAANDHMPDPDAEMIVREAAQAYDTALAVMDLDDAGRHEEAQDILIKLLTKSISEMDVRAFPNEKNHGAFMPHHRGASYLFNMTTADGSNLWPEWKFWTSNTGPSAWVAIAIVHHFEVTGEKDKTLMKELRSLGDAMLLLQDAKTQGGVRYGAHHTPDAPDYNQDFDRINSENEVSAHAALRKIAEATGDAKYTAAADNILHWLTQADVFNPETRQMQKGMMDPKTGLLFVDAVYQGGRWEIDPRHATDSGGTWTISSLTPKFIDDVWGKQASYRMWQSIRSNMGWTADYRRPGSGDEIAGVDFTNKDEGGRLIPSRDALISPEWTGGAVRAVEHLYDYYENGAGKGQLTPAELNQLGKDVRSMRAWLETHPNNYAYGPGMTSDRQGRTYWYWFSGHGTAMAAVYIRLNTDPLSSGKNAIHISMPPVSQTSAAKKEETVAAASSEKPCYPGEHCTQKRQASSDVAEGPAQETKENVPTQRSTGKSNSAQYLNWDLLNAGKRGDKNAYQRLIAETSPMFTEHPDWEKVAQKTNQDLARELHVDGKAPIDQAKVANGWWRQVDKEKVFSNGPLNDGAAALFMIAQSYERLGEHEKAVQTAVKLLSHYSMGLVWDNGGWFWSPALSLSRELNGVYQDAASKIQQGESTQSLPTPSIPVQAEGPVPVSSKKQPTAAPKQQEKPAEKPAKEPEEDTASPAYKATLYDNYSGETWMGWFKKINPQDSETVLSQDYLRYTFHPSDYDEFTGFHIDVKGGGGARVYSLYGHKKGKTWQFVQWEDVESRKAGSQATYKEDEGAIIVTIPMPEIKASMQKAHSTKITEFQAQTGQQQNEIPLNKHNVQATVEVQAFPSQKSAAVERRDSAIGLVSNGKSRMGTPIEEVMRRDYPNTPVIERIKNSRFLKLWAVAAFVPGIAGWSSANLGFLALIGAGILIAVFAAALYLDRRKTGFDESRGKKKDSDQGGFTRGQVIIVLSCLGIGAVAMNMLWKMKQKSSSNVNPDEIPGSESPSFEASLDDHYDGSSWKGFFKKITSSDSETILSQEYLQVAIYPSDFDTFKGFHIDIKSDDPGYLERAYSLYGHRNGSSWNLIQWEDRDGNDLKASSKAMIGEKDGAVVITIPMSEVKTSMERRNTKKIIAIHVQTGQQQNEIPLNETNAEASIKVKAFSTSKSTSVLLPTRRDFLGLKRVLGTAAVGAVAYVILGTMFSQSAAAMDSSVMPTLATSPLSLLAGIGLAAMIALNVVYVIFKGVLTLFNQYRGQQQTLMMLRDRLSKVNLKIQTTSAYLFTIPMGYILDAIIRKRVDEKLAALRNQAAVAIAA